MNVKQANSFRDEFDFSNTCKKGTPVSYPQARYDDIDENSKRKMEEILKALKVKKANECGWAINGESPVFFNYGKTKQTTIYVDTFIVNGKACYRIMVKSIGCNKWGTIAGTEEPHKAYLITE